MKKLVDFVEIEENNAECVILKVVGTPLEMMKLGCFNGDEEYIRLTKGGNHTCTIWTKSGSHYSWWWGIGGCTMVTNEMSQRGRVIQNCITQDLNISI